MRSRMAGFTVKLLLVVISLKVLGNFTLYAADQTTKSIDHMVGSFLDGGSSSMGVDVSIDGFFDYMASKDDSVIYQKLADMNISSKQLIQADDLVDTNEISTSFGGSLNGLTDRLLSE